jgi:cytochrome c oxidase assembly protein subunit 15
MRRPRLTPDQFKRIALIATILLGLIIVTGASVRLTGSGLGCPDWPNCEPGRLTPQAATDSHAMIEFVNRLVTGLVSIAVIVAVLGSLFVVPRRRSLIVLSLGLVLGVLVQIVLGKLVVEELLSPRLVMAHFLVSMVLLADAIVLYHRASMPASSIRPVPIVSPAVAWLARLLVLAAAITVVTGTVVTGAGPHSGDIPGIEQRATRLDIAVTDAARVHGTSAMVFLALVLVTFALVRRSRAPESVQRRLAVLLVVLVAQAGVGYAQYFNDIPALLVGLHVAGATCVWAAALWFLLGTHELPTPGEWARAMTRRKVLAGSSQDPG